MHLSISWSGTPKELNLTERMCRFKSSYLPTLGPDVFSPQSFQPSFSPYFLIIQWANDSPFSEASNRPGLDLGRLLQYV